MIASTFLRQSSSSWHVDGLTMIIRERHAGMSLNGLAVLLLLLLLTVSQTQASTQYASQAGAKIAGDDAHQRCLNLAKTFKPSGLTINNTFALYYAEGSNPTLLELSDSYPNDTLPPDFDLEETLEGVAPDANIRQEEGYGKANKTRAASNGETGGLPPFCRFGAFVKTSNFTNVLVEAWMRESQVTVCALRHC